MRTLYLLLLSAGLLLLTSPGVIQGRMITIDFDRDPVGDPIANGTILNDLFAPFGVRFERVGSGRQCGSGSNVYANENQDADGAFASAPNNVSICAGNEFSDFSEGMGLVAVLLDREAVEACIVVHPSPSQSGLIQIVGAGGEVRSQEVSDPGQTEELCISDDSPFRQVQFSGNDNSFARFDDLRITFAPIEIDFDTVDGVTPIPDGTRIDGLYADLGVLFSRSGKPSAPCGDGFAYANDDLGAGQVPVGSPPNVVSVCRGGRFSDFSETTQGLVRAEFAARVNSACIDAFPTGAQDSGVIRGFDQDGDEVEEMISDLGEDQMICVSSLEMTAVEFGGFDTGYARFDDLAYTFGAASLDFDTDLEGVSIGSGTVVNETYAAAGVLLERDGPIPAVCGTGFEVYANGDVTGDDFASSPNQVSVCNTRFSDFSEDREGTVHATFASDAAQVCVAVRATNSADFAVLSSFDHNDEEIDEVFSDPGASETLCTVGTGIRGVRFGGAGSLYARFDDLDVLFAAHAPTEPMPIARPAPEPGAGILALAAIASLARLRRAAAAGRPPVM